MRIIVGNQPILRDKKRRFDQVVRSGIRAEQANITSDFNSYRFLTIFCDVGCSGRCIELFSMGPFYPLLSPVFGGLRKLKFTVSCAAKRSFKAKETHGKA